MSKIVLAIMSKDSGEVLERWEFDIAPCEQTEIPDATGGYALLFTVGTPSAALQTQYLLCFSTGRTPENQGTNSEPL